MGEGVFHSLWVCALTGIVDETSRNEWAEKRNEKEKKNAEWLKEKEKKAGKDKNCNCGVVILYSIIVVTRITSLLNTYQYIFSKADRRSIWFYNYATDLKRRFVATILRNLSINIFWNLVSEDEYIRLWICLRRCNKRTVI